MHPLLRRQLRRHLDGADPSELPGPLRALVHAVDEAYRQADADRVLLERSLELTSQELLGRHAELREDAARRERADAERRRLEEQLWQSQKMDAVGRLAGGVAHDFNNMLCAILGHAELLAERSAGNPSLRDEVEEIRKAADRAASLTRRLLAFSRKQVLQPRLVSLNDLVTGMAGMLGRLIGEDIQLHVRLDPGLGSVLADPGQLEQVLLNLAVNARDAMPGGGRLAIETTNLDADRSPLPGLEAGAWVELRVTDSGTGMDEETRAHAFEPFFTTKPPGQGTGLGLATVYGIVTQSGGGIEVDSTPGAGTVFRILLPRQRARAVAAERAPDRALERGSETVLLVEDEDLVRRLVHRLLERAGYSVVVARDGVDALAALERHPGPIHLLLTDVVMPRMGGIELARRMESTHPDTRVLYVSGYTTEAGLQAGKLRPGASFLHKPFTTRALTTAVRQLLDAPCPAAAGAAAR